MIDFTAAAEFAAMHYREDKEQIDNMERSGTFPVETVQSRRSGLRMRAQIVHIVRVVANDAAIRDLVAQQLEGRGK